MEKLFLSLCAGLTDNGFQNPEKMNAVQFVYTIDYLAKKFKKLNDGRQNNRVG